MYKINSKKSKKNKLIILAVVALLLLCLVTFYMLQRNNSDVNQSGLTEEDATTTSNVPSAQSDFSEGEDRDPGNTLREDGGSGYIEAVNPENIQGVDRSNPIVSGSGEISVFAPRNNNILTSGQEIIGSSRLNRVNFRIIDNVSGVIAVGELPVSNGSFAGKIQFNTSATEGRIDIFGTRNDGVEFSNIEIPIRFR